MASCYLQVRFAGLDEFPGFFYQVTCLLERDLRAHTVAQPPRGSVLPWS